MKSNDRSHNNYALGWVVSMYRGHKYVRHGGGIDGFVTSTNFLPFDDIGVFVVNNAGSGISSQIALYAIDLMLDLEPVDRYAEMKERRAKADKSKDEKKIDDRVEGTSPSHPLPDYVGNYEHPGYGTISVSTNDDVLNGKFNSFEFVLEHFHYDVFQTTEDFDYGKTKFTFQTNEKGDIDQVSVPLESSVDPINFKRKAAEKFSGKEYLQKFVGKFDLEGLIVEFELATNNKLVIKPTGQPTFELIPYKENEFNFKDLTGYSIKFIEENDQINEARVTQPNGVFLAKRVK